MNDSMSLWLSPKREAMQRELTYYTEGNSTGHLPERIHLTGEKTEVQRSRAAHPSQQNRRAGVSRAELARPAPGAGPFIGPPHKLSGIDSISIQKSNKDLGGMTF